jgi:hypothetical protein
VATTEGRSTLSVGGDLTNSGQISVGTQYVPYGPAVLAVQGSLTDTPNGHLEVDGGEVSVADSVSNFGSITILTSPLGPGRLHTSNFSNAGTVTVDSIFTGSASSLTVGNVGAYTQTSSSANVDGTLMAAIVDIGGGKFSGTGTVTGDVVDDAVISPGNPGEPLFPGTTLTINGNYAQKTDGALLVDISSATDFSILDVSGKASLDGTAEFDFLNGYIPGPNTDFTFLEAGSVAGDFTSLEFMGSGVSP